MSINKLKFNLENTNYYVPTKDYVDNLFSNSGINSGSGSISGSGLEDWETNHNYAVDDIYVYEGEIYKTLIAFTSGATEDSRTKVNNIVTSVWAANTVYTAGDIIEHTDVTTLKKIYYNVTSNFTSGATFEVTAQMQELQIVEEYVPHPLTDAQVQNLINGFKPSGGGGVYTHKTILWEGTYNTSNQSASSFSNTLVINGSIEDYDYLFITLTQLETLTEDNYVTNVVDVSDITYNHPSVRLRCGHNAQEASYLITFTDATHLAICFQDLKANPSPAITKIVGIKFISSPNNYSTEEQRIGTWIDGKPLYQKTFICDLSVSHGDWVNSNISSNNIKQVVASSAGNDTASMNYISCVANYPVDGYIGVFSVRTDTIAIVKHFTLQYTKTTD